MSTRQAAVTTPGPREIRVERIFDAERERVWRAMTEPALLAQWWGRGNKLVIERFEPVRGGHWRFVEHAGGRTHGFEGRFRELQPPERLSMTFEWDGQPGHVVVNTITLEDLGDGRTRLLATSLFISEHDRDGMMQSGMEQGMNQSYAALDGVLAAVDDAPAPPAPRPRALSVRKVAFTMYPIADVTRARAFYEDLLGLSPGQAGGQGGKHWIEYDLPGGGCLALTNTTGNAPSAGAGGTIALEVLDLSALMAHLKERGVEFKSGVIRGPHCAMAMCLDAEGNSLLLHQLDAD